MKIDTLSIQKFRCFGPEFTRIDFEDSVTVFVGGNGSGKTAVLQALSRLFGVTTGQRSVRSHDFYIPPNQPELLSGASLSLEVVFSFPELEGMNEEAIEDAVPEFFMQMTASERGAPLKARMALRATWTDDGTADGTVSEEIRWITTLDDEFEWDECKKVQAVERGSIQLVYVPATRNAAEQVTAFLKGRLWQAAKWSEKFRKTSERSAGVIQRRFEKESPAQFVLERLTHRWKQVHEADTDTTPIFRIIENRFEELVRKSEFAFYPDEAGRERALADLSDGQRSLFHIALTAATLEVERDAFALPPDDSSFDHEKVRRAHLTVLAIEEPENSLSPFFLSRIIAQSRDIGALPSAQVALSSHSAAILSRIEPEEVRYFRLDRQVRRSSVRKLSLPTDDLEASQYVRLAVKAYPELYFARFVILGEGDTERLVIPRVAEAMGVHLDPSFVPIAPLGGRYVCHFWKLLTDLQIPHATLLDLDLGRAHGGANTVRTVVAALAEIGNDLSNNSSVLLEVIDPDDVDDLAHTDFVDGFDNNDWLQALKAEGVFFSDPIDLDFAMLSAFPDAYRHPHPGGLGPREDEESLQEKKAVTLKSGGDPSLFDDSYDEDFRWYPYLFLNRSKPETHLLALSRIGEDDLRENSPPELKALVEHVQDALAIEDGDE